ncbi:MAG: hypothetical protein SFV81_27455 [Pirellulaceae bacterium]|nr:hypothetical protein [Pirellulaceae bacterium]
MHFFQKQNLFFSFCCFVIQNFAFAQIAIKNPDPEEVKQFFAFKDNQAGFYIISFGDGISQTAKLTVFEILGEKQITIRRLHQIDLVNSCRPSDHILCGAGRFFLTFDEGYMWSDIRETRNLLVIYDLMRKEHTVLKYADLFSDDFFKDRGKIGVVSSSDWKQGIRYPEEHFDPLSLTFRIPMPESVKMANPTKFGDTVNYEIMIDLLMRTAKLQPIAGTANSAQKAAAINDSMNLRNYDIAISQGTEQSSRLPMLIRFSKLRGHVELVFELDVNTLEYTEVNREKWTEPGKYLKFRCEGVPLSQ